MKQRRAERARTNLVEWSHPETRPGELFLRNSCADAFRTLAFASRRQGTVAYDGGGRRLTFQDWHPVFLKQEELATRSLTLQELRRLLRDQEVPGCCEANP